MAGNAVWVPVRASMRGFVADFVREASGAGRQAAGALGNEMERGGRAAGQSAGRATADGMASQRGAIERVSRQLAAARDAEADAAGSVRVAEAKLAEARESGAAGSSKVVKAEQDLQNALARQEAAAGQAARASSDLDRIRAGEAETARAVTRAEDGLAKAKLAAGKAAGAIEVAEAQLAEVRGKTGSTAAQIATAEERVETLRRRGVSTADEVRTREMLLASAHEEVARAAQAAGEASEDQTAQLEETEQSMSSMISTAAAWGAGIAAAAVAAGTALFEMGAQFDDMDDALRVGTGASGAALEGLSESARAVAASTPAMEGGMEQIGQTMADLNTRTGATGATLETLTAQFVQLSNMGMDADINTVTQAMTGFGISADKAPAAMDELLRVSQSTGLSINDLANSAVKGGPALREFGFGLADSAALAGQLDKAGMDADKTMAAMTKGLSAFAKENKNPKEALQATVAEIQRFTKAGDSVGALNMASKLFGTRGAAQFVDAVKSGAFSVEGLKAASDGTGDTILGLADDTADFAEKWELFKQNVLLKIEPIATRVFSVISEAMAAAVPHIETAAKAFGAMADFISDNKVAFGILGGILTTAVLPALGLYIIAQGKAAVASVVSTISNIAGAWKTVGTALRGTAIAQWAMNSAVLANPLTWIIVAIVAAGAALWAFFTKTETGRKLWDKIWGGIKAAVSAVVDWFTNTAWPFIQSVFKKIGEIAVWLWQTVMLPAWNGIKTVISVWWTVVQVYFKAVMTIIRGIGTVVMWLWNNVMSPAWNGIKMLIAAWWSGVKIYFNFLLNIFKTIVSALGALKDWFVQKWEEMKLGFTIIWNVIKDKLGEFVSFFTDTIPEAVGKAKDWVIEKWNSVLDFFKSVPGKITSLASGMWDGIKEAFRAAVNFIIDGWNSIEFKIPGFKVGPIGFDGFTLGLPDIPRLAGGGTIASRDRDGRLRGPGTGTSDSIFGVNSWGMPVVRVANGEGVVNEQAMRGGGADVVAALNAGWVPSAGFLRGMVPGLAAGGVIDDQTYGLAAGTSISYGGSGFPQWITDIGAEHGVQPSTYPGHQESDRGEAGYAPNPQGLNRGIDWSGPVDKMQAFADWLMSIAPNSPGLEQVIWQNPQTGQKAGWAGRQNVTDSGYFASDYGGHQDHVHTRQASVFPTAAATTTPDATAPDATVSPTTPPATTETPDTTTTTAPDTTSASSSSSGQSWGQIAGAAVTEQLDDLATFFGVKDTWMYDPSKLGVNVGTENKPEETTPAAPAAPEGAAPTPGTEPPADATDPGQGQIQRVPEGSISMGDEYTPGDSGFLVKEAVIAAAERGFTAEGAAIGVATQLVESGDPVKMWANNADPESLQYPHDAVGSDHDSSGPFQQRNNGAWGTIAQRMNARGSASMFFNALAKQDWQSMDPGAAAQSVQRSAFPDRYATQMDKARQLVSSAGVFDTGGRLPHGGLALNLSGEDELILPADMTRDLLSPTPTKLRAGSLDVVAPDDAPTDGGRRGGGPLIGSLTMQAVDIDDGIRKVFREVSRSAEADLIAGGRV